MTRTTLVLLLLPALLFSFVQPTPSSESEDGWASLFNGRDLEQWSVQCQEKDQGAEFWSVRDGAITADSLDKSGHDYVWLMSNREYQDFTLRLKFRAFRESPGNSGVQIRSRYDVNEGWLDGPQIDIHPTGPWRCGMMWDETRGVNRWIFPDIPKGKWVNESMSVPQRKFYFADDETPWNQMEITAKGLNVKAVLNGVVITDFKGAGILDDEAHQKYNVGETGRIALQIHKGDQLKIQFKDLQIREH